MPNKKINKNTKNSFLNYLKNAISVGRKNNYDQLLIKDENGSNGFNLLIFFLKNKIGFGDTIEEYREEFYNLKKEDIKKIKDEMNIVKIRMKEIQDFGEWVRIIEINLV